MTPILVAGPAVEPIGLADIKGWLRLDDNGQDDLVMMLVTAARLLVEAASRRLLITQTWRLVLDRWPADRIVRVPLAPLQGLSAARVRGVDGALVAVPVAAFRLDTLGEPGRVILTGVVPGPGTATSGIELDVVAGYGPLPDDVPMPLRQAIRMLAARWFEHRGDGSAPADTTLPEELTALVAPYRRARL